MAYVVPQFPLVADFWFPPNLPPLPPDKTFACQLRAPGKQSTGQHPSDPFHPNLWTS
jgi:hypothetical protein